MSSAGGSWGSPTSQGPGWWQASDGLWYPPAEQQAAAPPPPAAAPVAPTTPQWGQTPQYAAPVVAPQYGQPAVPAGGVVSVTYDGPEEKVARLRPFYVVFLAIPQLFGALGAAIMAIFSMYAAIFGVLFKGRVHPSSHDTIVRAYRYQWRLTTFLLCWRNEPPAAPTTGAMDQGDDDARLSVAYGGEGLMRLGPIIKPFLAIPKVVVLFFAAIGMYIAMIIGLFGVLFTGTFPQSQRNTITRFWQRSTELNAYVLLTDVKPN